jgi:quercetin dioxygenase-like cupin family protein
MALATHRENCRDCPVAGVLGPEPDAEHPGKARVRVRDLLIPGRRVWCAGDRAALADVGDRLMYVAARDVLPEFQAARRSWRSDLVRYFPGVLPGGEPHRSIGHWNHPGQIEAFEVLDGRVGMFIGSPGGAVFYSEAGSGDVMVLPPGAWHLTYVLGAGALVFNVYADGDDGPGKYTGSLPVRHWLRQLPGGASPQSPPGHRAAQVCPAARWRPDVPVGGPCLAARMTRRRGTEADLAAIAATAARGWPGPVLTHQ